MTVFTRRRLPHYHAIDQPIFLTWTLSGSLPPGRSFPKGTDSGKAFAAVDRILDAGGRGPRYLQMPLVAGVVQEAIFYRDGREYELHAYVVMPNHVHLLVTPLRDVAKIMHSLKRFTAREANKLLGLTGQAFWQDESYDRFVRNDVEFARIAGYIEGNPVKAGLCFAPEEFPYSSAWRIANPPQAASLPHIMCHRRHGFCI